MAADGNERFEELLGELEGMPDLRRGKAFGLPVIKVGGKIAAAFQDGQLVLKLPRERIADLIDRDQGEPFSAYGKTMTGWVALSAAAADDWLALTEEAVTFVRPA